MRDWLLWVGAVAAVLAGCGDDGTGAPSDDGGGDATHDAGFDTGPARMLELRVNLAGDGSGVVRSDDGTFECGDGATRCTARVLEGTELTLIATASDLSHFAGWAGPSVPCTNSDTCTIEITTDGAITASFDLDELSLMVTTDGGGTGAVSSDPAGIDCGESCAASYLAFTEVTLAATPEESSVFTGWDGACTGTEPTCAVTMDEAKSVRASFELRDVTLTVALAGAGTGTVTSDPAGIDCGATCTVTVPWGTTFRLTAAEDAVSSVFDSWAGCTPDGASCTVELTDDTSVTATFVLRRHDLTVALAGSGSGSVSSSPAGIDCGSDCTESYDHATAVTLTAAPVSTTSVFAGWGGACAGTSGSTCVVDVLDDAGVTATFELADRQLNVGLTGLGTGTVTSAPAGVDCGSDCGETYAHGTMVTLTASPDTATSVFRSWTGACTGTTPTCDVAMTAVRSVTARFDRAPRAISVTIGGTGAGRVNSSPGGIGCPSDCAEAFAHGTTVTLTAEPSSGSSFTAWGGACAGTPFVVCTLVADADQTVSVTFD